jgi:hypothetical protein
MNEAPSKILLIISPEAQQARAWARLNGLAAALTLGSARVITRPESLRGWRAGTLFRSVGWTGDEPEAGAMSTVLNALVRSGTLKPAEIADVEQMKRELVA